MFIHTDRMHAQWTVTMEQQAGVSANAF